MSFIKKICPNKNLNFENFELLNEKDPINTSHQLNPCLKGENIGLLTDAGCPNIADPGSLIVLLAHENDINVIPLIGPSSIFLAIMSSGLNGNNFSFIGYLPIKSGDRIKKIKKIEMISQKFNQSQIFIETPYRNEILFKELLKILNKNTYLCVAKNIGSSKEQIKTKKISYWKNANSFITKDPIIYIIHTNEIIF
tara:strand:- start:24714 stop:25301 length:588 start_codon:yes stop_codon:yes gene_type:complete